MSTDINFNYFPKDIQAVIKDVIVRDGNFNSRLICKHWKDVVDKRVLKIFVTQLVSLRNNPIKKIPTQITSQAKIFGLDFESMNNSLPLKKRRKLQ
jgi:hypothetical protein